MKKIYYLIVVMVIFILLLIVNIINNDNINIILTDNLEITVDLKNYGSNNYNKNLYNVIDDGKTYYYEKGKLEIVKRNFDNEDVMFFYSSDSKKSTEITLKLDYSILNLYSLKKYEKIKEYSNIVGYDNTTIPAYYVEFSSGGSALISKSYHYKELYKKYKNVNESVIRHLVKENDIQLNIENNTIKILTSDEKVDGWILFSKTKLFENEEEIKKYTHELNTNGLMSAWLTTGGQYTKIPYSIDPSTKEGYGRNPGANHGISELNLYRETKKNLYYDLVWNKIMGLYNMKRHETGVWYTEYTSTFISKPYDVYAPFVDTRHNENIAQFIEMMGNEFNIDEFKNASLYYPNYIVSEVNNGNIIKLTNDLYLIPDYFKNNSNNKTHASINHQLGTANLLLQTYQKTKDEKYFNVGIKILKGLEYLGEKWTRENGDLWYRMNPDYTFEGTDYKTLTLKDLLIVQSTLEKIGYGRMSLFDKYIESKYKYLKTINYDIDVEIVKMLKEQNFIKK